MNYTIEQESDYALPSDIMSSSAYLNALPFFQYRAAPVSHTSLSFDIDNLFSEEEKGALYLKLIDGTTDSFLYGPKLEDFIDEAFSLGITDQALTFDQNKGWFYCPNKKTDNQSSNAAGFTHLLRHIRNSIAHGRIASEEGFFIFEDKFGSNSKAKSLSARIVIEADTFCEWALIIDQACKQDAL